MPAARPHDIRVGQRRHVPARAQRGFTLIELLVAMVVLAVLMAIALPAFNESIRKSRRSDALVALSAIQQAQERWRSNNANYTTTLSDLAVTTPTSGGLYDLSLSASGGAGDTLANAYVATAVGRDGTSQAQDAQCRRMSVRLRSGNLEYAGCGSCEAFTYGQTSPCWAR